MRKIAVGCLVRAEQYSIGPFMTRGATAWMFPCAIMMVSFAILICATFALISAFADSMTCTGEIPMAITVTAMLTVGVSFLGVLALKHSIPNIVVAALLGVLAGAAGSLVIAFIYAPHCNALLPVFRQLLPA